MAPIFAIIRYALLETFFCIPILPKTAIDLSRSRYRKKELPLEDWADYPSPNLGVSDYIEIREACSEIAACAAKLNESYSIILYLSLSLQFSDKEIARILGITHSNVRMRLSRARKALLSQLEKEAFFSYD